MGYFSELSQELDQGRELPVDTAAFEDEETFAGKLERCSCGTKSSP